MEGVSDLCDWHFYTRRHRGNSPLVLIRVARDAHSLDMTQSTLFELTPPPTVPPVAEIEVRRKARAAAMEKADAGGMAGKVHLQLSDELVG